VPMAPAAPVMATIGRSAVWLAMVREQLPGELARRKGERAAAAPVPAPLLRLPGRRSCSCSRPARP
jgi:hypothetical protein